MARHKNCLMRLEKPRLIRAAPGAATVVLALAVMAAVACSGPQPVTPSEDAPSTAAPEPAPTTAITAHSTTMVPEPTLARLAIDGETWILESVDGRPLIGGTYATLTIDGPQFGGFDGCNSFGGRHETGEPVVQPNGTISVPVLVRTAAGCPTDAVLNQAKRYLNAMTQQARASVVDERLHVIDDSGDIALVFSRQASLADRPAVLEGTAWQLVDHDALYGEALTTLLFLHNGVAVGTTACRDYQIGYSTSNSRIRIPSKGMAGSTEQCPQDAVRKEHLYVEDLGWANEYTVDHAAGVQHMTVRTSRGKTLAFEPLDQEPDNILRVQWRLIRFFESRSDRSATRWLTDTDIDSNTDITANFSESTVEGTMGCYWYAYRGAGVEGRKSAGPDGSISMGDATLSKGNRCENQAPMSLQQDQYLDYLENSQRYHVFLDRLVIVTNSGNALMFQSNTEELETTSKGDLFDRLSTDAGCTGLEVPQDQEGLISRDKAEDMATEFLAMSAPGVSGTEIEKIWASCLTTLKSYEKDLLRRNDSIAPDTPVWIVEVEGISRPAGISAANAGKPYHYALAVMNAETGDTIAQSRHPEPLMQSAMKVNQ